MLPPTDEAYLRLTFELAKKGSPSPNPYVGAVVVKDGKILGAGFHKQAGMAHAEPLAISQAGKADGATLYVSLEPCSHLNKRTPPCTEKIIHSGISRVVCAMSDPNPLVKGIEILRKNGIEVEVAKGKVEAEAKRLNETFIHFMTTKRPFVMMKMAMSLDGKIAANSGDSKWISSEESRKFVHQLRSQHDAVMVGAGTVLQDDPSLTSHGIGRDPHRIIIDGNLKIPLDAKVLRNANVTIVTSSAANKSKLKKFQSKHDVILAGSRGKVDLRLLMPLLARRGITSILLEGGSELNASALKAGIVNKFLFFIAPKIISGRNAKGPIGGEGIASMKKAIPLHFKSFQKIGDDFLLEAYPK